MQPIKLGIIGYKSLEDCEQTNAQFFNYTTCQWQLPAYLYIHYEEIRDIVEKCVELNLDKYGLTLLQEEFQQDTGQLQTVLMVVYNNALKKPRQKEYDICCILSKLLPILYSNYKTSKDVCLQIQQSIFSPQTRSRKLVTTYVTSQLYDALYSAHLAHTNLDIDMNLPAEFKSTLYKFQKRTVHWLLQRELKTELMLPVWEKLLPKSTNQLQNIIFKHKYRLCLQTERPNDITLPKGGILADEMGLGKTLEMLALITLNPREIDNETSAVFELCIKNNVTNDTVHKIDVFCLCAGKKTSSKLVQCEKCLRSQHIACVTKFDSEHDISINKPYFCPLCWHEISKQNLLISAATIIVTPISIRAQWLAEIKLHTPTLQTLCYDAHDWISPRQLADYDVVITDYNVLRGEVYHTDKYVSERATRHPPRSMRRFTPLTMLEWHRVCLDEAQMIETNTSQLAELVHKLPAVHRWSVTGTPIQKSINDLEPLLQFVGFHEFCDAWKALVHNFLTDEQFHNNDNKDHVPPLIELLQQCMWRTCKKNIINEIELPPQSIQVHNIKLGDLEMLNYMEQHEKQYFQFQHVLNKHADNIEWGIRTISPQILHIILQPLLRIRQCCSVATIPNSKNKFKSKGNMLGGQQNKQFLYPSELHAHMKSVNETECKTELRTMTSAYNGMASVKFLQNEYYEAINYYEQVLKLAKDYNNVNNISVDSLLQIHAIHNLIQANSFMSTAENEAAISTEAVNELEKQCGLLEWKYLEPYNIILKSVHDDYQKAVNFFIINPEETLITDMSYGIDNLPLPQCSVLMEKLRAEASDNYLTASKYMDLQSLSGYLYFLDLWIKNLLQKRLLLQKTFETLKFFTENMSARHQVPVAIWRNIMALVQKVYNCHLNEIRDKPENEDIAAPKAKKEKKTICILCKCNQELEAYFCLLYDTELSADNNRREGVERTAIEIQFIRTILQFMRNKFLSNEQINSNLETLEMLQTFYQRASKYWIELEYAVKAYDELNMCKMRLSITDNVAKTSNFRVLRCELDDIFQMQWGLLNQAQTSFVKKLGRLKYINHLGENSEIGSCPICHIDFENRYAVLECGHYLCLKCLKILNHNDKQKQFDCSICRNRQSINNIYFVTTLTTDKSEFNQLRCNYSSKIIKILQVLRELKEKDPCTKVLIFSQWMPILDIIKNALKEYNISFRMEHKKNAVKEFKDVNLNIMCLLMPLHRGSKGLNLVEATHVFLVEPILNPGEELQALGRVHRFGQTKATTVHRFIVTNSIEENIYNFTTKAQYTNGKSWQFEDMTLQDLEQLFVLKSYGI